jgi:hypothetical protein
MVRPVARAGWRVEENLIHGASSVSMIGWPPRMSGAAGSASGCSPLWPESTLRRQARILMDVHPGLRHKAGWCRNPSLTPQTRMNNLNSFQT